MGITFGDHLIDSGYREPEEEHMPVGRPDREGGWSAERSIDPVSHIHEWSKWKEIGRTGDWFHPLIVERVCKTCGATETDEH